MLGRHTLSIELSSYGGVMAAHLNVAASKAFPSRKSQFGTMSNQARLGRSIHPSELTWKLCAVFNISRV